MRFVGPRPESHPASSSLAWSLKPGLTSMEEAGHAPALSEDERERLRLFYMKNYSPFLDAEILIKNAIAGIQKEERSEI
jgi:lipopolysaccharide/colanic/teichoic acid biosynthesis glycosyltransferase